MRRIVIALMGTLSGLALLFSYGTSTNQPGSGSTTAKAGPTTTTAGSTKAGPTVASGTFTGTPVDTRWGVVQVRITVSGRKVTAAHAIQVPSGNQHDVEINNVAVPILDQAVLAAQNASFDGVSGATVTSDGYKQSLQSALDQAHV